MPTFETPDPITATITVIVGDAHIRARDGATTVVDVQPSDPSSDHDVKAAQLTRVELADGRLLVKTPKPGFPSRLARRTASVDVTIELPAGSDLHAVGHLADFRCEGPLNACEVKTGLGDISVDRAATASLKTGSGDVALDHATGHVAVATASGDVRLGELESTATVKGSNGNTWVAAAGGDLRVGTAAGDVAIGVARASVVAKSARGDLRLGEAVRGSVVLETQAGDVEVGIPEGTAAWIDASVHVGTVQNALEAADSRGEASETVEVRARTSVGDITIRRSALDPAAA